MQPTLRRLSRTLTRCRCLVCGFSEVRTDEVFHRGLVLLHECPHCEHRWTRAVLRPAPAVAPSRRPGRVSRAA